MRIEYINPFIEATFEVLSEVLRTDSIKRGELFLKKSITPSHSVSIIIGITGPANGRVIIDMEEPTALKILQAMTSSSFNSISQIGEYEKSALSELGNIITGSAIAKLYKKGFAFVLTPPTVITGKDYDIDTPQIETLVVPIILPIGQIEINIALKES
ncbi:MAG: chemotaxis protein CheX [Spirochaetia bacterium]|nr:chemotaxis protein CheX [Spirochaetota bacterium]MCX8096780.1 chemotaxis protein CheX [Spirochaetota bacterium]MDW8112554.1 chemotaxis protein CheX [Spirochaetia bacterium]